MSSTEAHAHGAHTRERSKEWNFPEDLDANFLCNFHQSWADVEEKIEELQNTKKAMVAGVRAKYGRSQAEAVKLTMKLMSMDEKKRFEHFHFNDTAERYAKLILENERYRDA